MPLAARFDEYGDVDVLKVVEVPRPVPESGQILVRVVAAGMDDIFGTHGSQFKVSNSPSDVKEWSPDRVVSSS
jgi:NADPH:quinone reductase-like Zn-dependent oxidoreductase